MNKTCQWIENLVFLIGLQTAYFFAVGYRHLLYGSGSAWGIVFDSLIGILFGVFLLKAFVRNTSFFGGREKPLSPKGKLLWFSFLVTVGAMYEIAVPLLSRISVEWKYFGRDFAAIVCWLAIYAVTNIKRLAQIEKKEWLCLGIFFGTAVAATILLNVSFLEQYRTVLEKYTEHSPYLQRFCQNLDFRFCVKAAVTDTLIGGFLITFHMCTRKRENDASEALEECRNARAVCVSLLRCNIIVVLCVLIVVVKSAIIPSDVLIKRYTQQSWVSSSIGDGKADVSLSSEEFGGNYGSGEGDFTDFRKVTVVLSKPGIGSETFILNGSEPNYVLSDSESHISDPYICLETGANTIYLYGYYAISWNESNMVHIIRTDSLGECVESKTLTNILEALLGKGNLFAFEYGYEYLLKYDAAYVEPYIERYAKGDFTRSESEWLDKTWIRQEYIRNIAQIAKESNR